MNVFFNESKSKTPKLIDALKKTIDGQKTIDSRKKYNLYIASCYLSEDLRDILLFINELIDSNIKIQSVNLYIDARQVIKTGTDKLIKFADTVCNERGEEWLNIYAVDTPQLFHSKGFAFLSEDEKSGALIIGSSNFSKSGLFGKTGNFESCLLTNDVSLVNEFLKSIPGKYLKNLDDLQIFKTTSLSFKYALIQEGYFVRKWSGSIQQYFSVKYELTELGKQQIDAGGLKRHEFDLDADTVSKQFLSLENISSAHSEEFDRLLSKGIETHLGHWIPKSILDNIDEQPDLEIFYQSLSKTINDQIHKNEDNWLERFKELSDSGFIIEATKNPIEIIQQKLHNLKDHSLNLRKFYSKFSIFELPYDLSQTSDIKDLYEEIEYMSENRKMKNNAMRRVIHAIHQKNPSLINSDEE